MIKHVSNFIYSNLISLTVVAAFIVIAITTHTPHMLWGVACTLTARSYKPNAAGALTQKMWNITGDNAYTFDTGIKSARTVAFLMEPNNIITAIAQSTVNGQIRLTFTATGAFANMDLFAILRNG